MPVGAWLFGPIVMFTGRVPSTPPAPSRRLSEKVSVVVCVP